MLPEPIAVTIKVTAALEKLGIPYFIGGSLASTLYGMVRTTQDSDIVADMRAEHVRPFVASMQSEFFVDEDNDHRVHPDQIRFQHHPSREHVQGGYFHPEPAAVSPVSIEACPKTNLPGRPRSKRQVCQRGGHHPFETGMVPSARRGIGEPVADVLGILRTRAGALDLDYLRTWGKELKVSDLLEQLLEESTS